MPEDSPAFSDAALTREVAAGDGAVDPSDAARFASRILSIFALSFLLRDHGVLGLFSMAQQERELDH